MRFLAKLMTVVALNVFPIASHAEIHARQFVDAFKDDCFDLSNEFALISENMKLKGAREVKYDSNALVPGGLNILETKAWFVDGDSAPQYLMTLSHAVGPSGEGEVVICGFSTPIATEAIIILDLIEVFQLPRPESVEEIDGKRIQQWSLLSNGNPVILRLSDKSPSFERGISLVVLSFGKTEN